MKRTLPIALIFLVGCSHGTPDTRAVLNLDYASTSLGYRNSGAISAGRLLLWDQQNGTLITLQSDIPLKSRPTSAPTRYEASSVQGVTVSASLNLTDAAKAAIASEVRNNVKFEVNDAVRHDSIRIYDGLTTAYRKLAARGVNAYSAWRVADATEHPNRYKYVLTVDEVHASSESIAYDRTNSNSISFKVHDQVSGEIKVESPKNATAKCSGKDVTCYVNVSVLHVFINDARNLDYSPADFRKADLVQAFRNL